MAKEHLKKNEDGTIDLSTKKYTVTYEYVKILPRLKEIANSDIENKLEEAKVIVIDALVESRNHDGCNNNTYIRYRKIIESIKSMDHLIRTIEKSVDNGKHYNPSK